MFFGQLHLAIFLPPRAVCLGPPKCLDVIYNHTNLPCQVYFLYVIACCGEIVTPSAVFINHLLSTSMATMLSSKWKASYDSIFKYRNKQEETFVWVQKVANGPEAAYCTYIVPLQHFTKN